MDKKEKFKIKNLLYLFISLAIAALMVYIGKKVGVKEIENINYIYLIISGFLMSIGIVIPGVSNTIILMLLGVYPLYLSSVSTLYFPVLITMAIGIIFGCLLFMKIIKYLLDKFYNQTMFLIIGFTLGSIVILIPEIVSINQIFIFITCILFGYYSMELINNY